VFHVARNLVLPREAVTQTFAFLGKKGSGKTYAASRLVESFLDEDVPVVVLDPVGNWHGLRLKPNGKPSPYEVPVLGGAHGDLPLLPEAGETVARFVVDSRTSCVLDVSEFRKGKMKQFVTGFAEGLFAAKKASRFAMHLVLEEAQMFCPQMVRGQEQMVGALTDLVRLGRNYGIGVSMVSQRPQSVNKEVLNQAEPVVVFQLTGKHERKAVGEWMEYVGIDVDQLDELPGLDPGDCFFWSPGWLRQFVATRFLKKRTMDASVTPIHGDAVTGAYMKSARLAPGDLEALREAMKETVERAEAQDPRRLRAELDQLQAKYRAVERRLADAVDSAALSVEEAVAELDAGWRSALEELERGLGEAFAECRNRMTRSEIARKEAGSEQVAAVPPAPPGRRQVGNRKPGRTPGADSASRLVSFGVTGGARRMLEVLVQRFPNRLTTTQLATLAGLKSTTGTFSNYKSMLRTSGLAEDRGGTWSATEAGRDVVGRVEPDTLEQLRDRWRRAVGTRPADLLDVLIEAYPRALSREDAAGAIGVSPTTGTFSNYLSKLRSNGLLEDRDGGVAATRAIALGE